MWYSYSTQAIVYMKRTPNQTTFISSITCLLEPSFLSYAIGGNTSQDSFLSSSLLTFFQKENMLSSIEKMIASDGSQSILCRHSICRLYVFVCRSIKAAADSEDSSKYSEQIHNYIFSGHVILVSSSMIIIHFDVRFPVISHDFVY